jgi:hypothetical protein
MGRLAMGIRALGSSSGLELNGFRDSPGPHKMRAWKSVVGAVACGMLWFYMKDLGWVDGVLHAHSSLLMVEEDG